MGFAFVDASVGSFYVGALRDDVSRAGVQALMMQVAPQEVLFEQGGGWGMGVGGWGKGGRGCLGPRI